MEIDYTQRILARALILNETRDKILLVKNRGTDFWYPPGGGWEPDIESIEECVIRECKEEIDADVTPLKLAYVQEFKNKKKRKAMVELFWVCEIISFKENKAHVDLDPNGTVETFEWFSRTELENITIFPEIIKDNFWDNLETLFERPDIFLK